MFPVERERAAGARAPGAAPRATGCGLRHTRCRAKPAARL